MIVMSVVGRGGQRLEETTTHQNYVATCQMAFATLELEAFQYWHCFFTNIVGPKQNLMKRRSTKSTGQISILYYVMNHTTVV